MPITHETIRQRILRVIHDVEQLARDVDAWNALHPEETPMDIEGDRIVLSKARGALAAWDDEDREEFDRQWDELLGYMDESYVQQ